jgi:hypothetical protein
VVGPPWVGHGCPAGRVAESREALVVGRLCDKRPFSDADSMATIPNQNTGERLSDVIDEGDTSIHHIRITILALRDSRAASLQARRSASIPVKRDPCRAGPSDPCGVTAT